MKKLNKKKKILLAVVSGVLVLAIVAGVLLMSPGGGETVGVYPFMYMGMTEYWGDNQESYGPVTSDNIQTVFLTDTQIVTEIKVKAGDTVKKGDILMTFDTTLSGLELERKRLDMEKKKLNLEIAMGELSEILEMKPTPEEIELPEELEKEDLGVALTDSYRISNNRAYDGSSESKALICWMKDTTSITPELLEAIRKQAEALQMKNASSASAMPELPELFQDALTEETEPEETKPEETQPVQTVPAETEPLETKPEVTEPVATVPEATEPEMTEPEETKPEETKPEETEPEETEPEETEPEETEPEETEPEETKPEETEPEETEPEETEPEETEPEETEPEETEPEDVQVSEFYVIFKTTQDNMSLGARLQWQGLHVVKGSGGFQFRFYDAYAMEDYTIADIETNADKIKDFMDGIDWGSGLTIQQIRQMRAQKQEEIKGLEFDLKMAETEYKIMQNELEDGNVYAQVDGDVVTVLAEEEARMTRQPIIKVSGGGGYYVNCSVSELEKDKMQIGQEVTVNDWNTGMTYTGTVESLGDFPSSDGYWNGMGNPNTTYYPFTVFIDGSADLQSRSYVSVMFSTSSGENGIYLENPFIRTEQGQSYVYVLGENGRLEQRSVVTGKSLWGSYTEILSGITEEDLIAFPYGKNVKDGAPAEERDISELYSY